MISHHRPCGRWCFARLIRQAETLELQLHSQPPSKRTALSPLKRSCFRFAARTLRCRTEPAFQAAPVFRSAYFPKKPFGFFYKTLDLQVRSAHPPMPHRNLLSEGSGVPHGLFMISHHRPCGRWCFARLIRQAETHELQPLRGLRWAGGASLPPAPPSPAPALPDSFIRTRDGFAQADGRKGREAGFLRSFFL